jgi:hypothetical protein
LFYTFLLECPIPIYAHFWLNALQLVNFHYLCHFLVGIFFIYAHFFRSTTRV